MGHTWTTICRESVPQVLQERDWQLIEDLPAFVAQVEQAIIQGIVRAKPGASREAVVRRATIHLYCVELYRACGENGTLRQHRAFKEIECHAQGVAYRYERDLDIIQLCVQQALTILWEKRETIRDPGSVLRWVEQVVYFEIKGYWKKHKRQRETPMSQAIRAAETESSNDETVQRFWQRLTSIPPPDDEVADRDLSEQLWHELHRVLADNPRYEAVIVGCFRYGLGASVLAEILQTPVSNVHVIKSRALSRLRKDESFVRRFADALETIPDRPGGKA